MVTTNSIFGIGGFWYDVAGKGASYSAPTDTFVHGVTRAQCADPVNGAKVASGDNVGWDGNFSGGVITVNQTLGSGVIWRNKIINAKITMAADGTSGLENCLVVGNVVTPSDIGVVIQTADAYYTRCTFWGDPASVMYAMNGIKHTGGKLTARRCVFGRFVDAIHSTYGGGAANQLDVQDCLFVKFAFFDGSTGTEHASDPTHPGWTHNDAIQMLSNVTGTVHTISGNTFQCYMETAGVVWSGGSWGAGTASGGDLGMPSTALNAGYWNEYGLGTWANGITFSNNGNYTVTFDSNFVDGVNATSGMFQVTPGSIATLTITNNRLGMGGEPSGSGVLYFFTWPTGCTVTQSGNIYDNIPNVVPALRGTALTFTSGGAKYDYTP